MLWSTPRRSDEALLAGSEATVRSMISSSVAKLSGRGAFEDPIEAALASETPGVTSMIAKRLARSGARGTDDDCRPDPPRTCRPPSWLEALVL